MVCAALPIFRTIATQWTQISLFEACDKTKSELVAGLSFFLEGGAWPGPSWQWAGSSEHAQVTLCTFLPTWSCHFEGRALGRCTFTPTGCRACTCGLAVRSLALTRRPQEKYEAHFLHLAVVPSCLVPGLPFKQEATTSASAVSVAMLDRSDRCPMQPVKSSTCTCPPLSVL